LGSALIFNLPGAYRVKYYCTESEAKIEKDAIIGMMKVSRKSVVISIGGAGGAYCNSLPRLPEK
jgi:hypothetical protein